MVAVLHCCCAGICGTALCYMLLEGNELLHALPVGAVIRACSIYASARVHRSACSIVSPILERSFHVISVHHPVLTPPLFFAAVSPGAFKPACSTATWLAGALPSSVAVVKSFNNLSAYTLIHGDPLTEHMKSVAASDDYEAAQAAAELGRAMGLEVCTAKHECCCCRFASESVRMPWWYGYMSGQTHVHAVC